MTTSASVSPASANAIRRDLPRPERDEAPRRGDEPRFELPHESRRDDEPHYGAMAIPLPPERDRDQARSSQGDGAPSSRSDAAKSVNEGRDKAGQSHARGADAETAALVDESDPAAAMDAAPTAEGDESPSSKLSRSAASGASEAAETESSADRDGRTRLAVKAESSVQSRLDTQKTSASAPDGSSATQAGQATIEAAKHRLLVAQSPAQTASAQAAMAALVGAHGQKDLDAPAVNAQLGEGMLDGDGQNGIDGLDGLDLRPTERVFGTTIASNASSLASNTLANQQALRGFESEVANAVSRLVADARDDAQGTMRFTTETGQTFFVETRLDPAGRQMVDLRLISDDPAMRALLLERLTDLRSALTRIGFGEAQVSVERDPTGGDPQPDDEAEANDADVTESAPHAPRRRSPFSQSSDSPPPGRLHLIL